MRLRDVVAAAPVRPGDSAERALPRLLLAQVLASPKRGPAPAEARAACGADRVVHARLHLSLPSKDQLAGGAANPHTFRSESRRSATALRPVATGHRRAGRAFASTPLPVGSRPFQRRLGQRGQRICSRHLRLYAPRSYSGLPSAREHLPRTGGDFGHDQRIDCRHVRSAQSMVCSRSVVNFAFEFVHIKVYPCVSS